MKPLVNQKFLINKFPGKGGWSYVNLPRIIKDKSRPFGWVKVKGTIDGFEIKTYNLMPYGGNKLFLPLKAEIRKKIKKNEGDYVHVILYTDNDPLEVPEEMLLCLQDEPKALRFFNSLAENEQHKYIKWIYSAKQENTKVERLVKSIDRLLKGEKFIGR